MQIVNVDHFGPLDRTRDGFKYILVVVDSCTKLIYLATSVQNHGIKRSHCTFVSARLFNLFGFPAKVISDRGTAFTSGDFKKFMGDHEVKHVLVVVASPWANGLMERINRFFKTTLAKVAEKPKDWKDKLVKAQYVLNNM